MTRHRIEIGLHKSHYLLRMLLAAVTSFALNSAAAAQQTSAVETAPRGQRDVSNVSYGDWKKLCFKPGGARLLCRTSITGKFATGQMAIRVDIIEREGGSTKRLQIFSPVGMYLQIPVKLTIDKGKTYRVPYTWCLTNICIAATVASPQLLKDMSTGQRLRLEFADTNLVSLATSVPLAGFGTVYKGTPAQTFEQDIDE